MPVPALDALSTDIGHGMAGVRYGLRTIEQFLLESEGQRQAWIEMYPGWVLGDVTWTQYGLGHDADGAWYCTPTWPTFDGVPLVLAYMDVNLGKLERIDALDKLTTAPAPPGRAGWCHWDGTTLSVQLDPRADNVVVRFVIPVGTDAVVHPWTRVELLDNAGLNAFTGVVPDDWTVNNNGSGTILPSEGSTLPYEGSAYLRFTLSSSGTNQWYELYQKYDVREGEWYTFSGFYRGDITAGAAEMRVRVWTLSGSHHLDADGVSDVGSFSFCIETEADTGGEWRHFQVCLRAPWSSSDTRFSFAVYATSSGTSGTLDFDSMSMQYQPAWNLYQPRLTIGGIPTLEISKPDAFYGRTSVGIGGLRIANGDAYYESLMATYDWLNAPLSMWIGGRFPHGGEDLPLSACPRWLQGRAATLEVSDEVVSLGLADDRTVLDRKVPTQTFTTDDYPDLADEDVGRARVMAFGTVRQIRPTQYDVDSAGYGYYQTSDPGTLFGGGVDAVGSGVYSYLSEEAANNEKAGERVLLDEDDYDLAGVNFHVLRDVRPRIIDQSNQRVDFNIGGGALLATLSPGVYKPGSRASGSQLSIATDLEDKMNTAAGTSDISVTFGGPSNPHKFLIAKGAGTLQLLTSTGARRDNALWGVLGFNTGANKTGSLFYLADTAVGQGDPILRVPDSAGILDNVAGFVTGTPYDPIALAPDVAYYLLRFILSVDDGDIDVESFENARANAPDFSLYLDEQMPFAQIIELIETSTGAEIQNVRGVWRWGDRDDSIPADTPSVYDHELLGWGSGYDADDAYATIRIAYDRAGATGRLRTEENTALEVGVRHGRDDDRTFYTCLGPKLDATTRLSNIATIAHSKLRRFAFGLKGRGLLLLPGDKLRVSRDRGLDETGAISDVVVRVIGARHDLATWTTEVRGIEVRAGWILGVAGYTELGDTTIL